MKNNLEDFIRDNREKLDSKVPPPQVLGRIMEQVQVPEQPKENGILIPFRVIYWAAASIVLVAGVFAFWALQKKPDNTIAVNRPVVKQLPVKPQNSETAKPSEQLAQTQPVTSKGVEVVDRDIASRKSALLTRLKEHKPSGVQVMFAGLNDMESPATRINATSQVNKLKYAGHDVIDALVETLNTDPSSNVRLAALDGLTRFYREDYVRKKLIASLHKQKDPLVQIALIDLLTRMRESGILSELENIVKDENTEKPVKDCAYSGIIQLQSS